MRKITDIKVGYSCNNNCFHCAVAGEDEKELSIKKVIYRSFNECKTEILEAKQDGADEIVLTGGEPSIRDDFLNLLTEANRMSLKVNLQTNGRKFHDVELASKTAAFKNIIFSIALHGFGKEIHDKITRRKGSFDETVMGIENLVALKKFVSIKIVISRLNYKFLKKIIDLIISLKLKHINLAFPHGIGNAAKRFNEVVPRYTDIRENVYDTLEYCRKKGILFETEAIPYCFLKGFEESASEHFLAAHDIQVKPVGAATINWSERRLELKRKGRECGKCLFAKVCEGPWKEYIENYGDKEFKPIEINAQTMLTALVKYKRLSDFRSGKMKFDKITTIKGG